MFGSLTSAGAVEKLLNSGIVIAKFTAWSCDMDGQAKKCVERSCELAKNTSSSCIKSPCLDDHVCKKEELEAIGALSKVCSPIVLKCICLAHRLTRGPVVCAQTGTSSGRVDRSLCQTLGPLNFVHPPHEEFQAVVW